MAGEAWEWKQDDKREEREQQKRQYGRKWVDREEWKTMQNQHDKETEEGKK